MLGIGNYASVRVGVEEKSNKRFAVKVYEKSFLKTQSFLVKNLEREIEILRKVDHPSVMTLFHCIESQEQIYLVTELLPMNLE